MPTLLPYYAALFVGIAFGVAGQVLLKTGSMRTADVGAQFFDPFTLMGLVAYALAAIFYIVAIKRIPISLAYPTISISYVAVALIAHYAWGETVGLAQIAGIALVIAGIVVMHQG
jgi:small multidrug resistance pump